jgi:hypothetical protein
MYFFHKYLEKLFVDIAADAERMRCLSRGQDFQRQGEAVCEPAMFQKITAFLEKVKILAEIFLWPEYVFWSIVFSLLRFARLFPDFVRRG